jgi:hypothetical protein
VTNLLSEDHQRALSALELNELTLLNWGAVDGAYSKQEAIGIISTIQDLRSSPEDIFRDLVRTQLLVRAGDGIPHRYRTRFAEIIRLLLKLRQLRRKSSWRTGRFLVSDGRIVHRPRKFPKRNIAIAEIVSRLSSAGHENDVIRSVEQIVGTKILSDFQVEATESILRTLENGQNAGFVVSAATSGGKSLAFYLPVLSWIATQTNSATPWVKAIALYPRNELLKDQLSSAYASARLLDATQLKNGRPRICVGTFYGQTVTSAKDFSYATNHAAKQWPQKSGGRRCPFMRCPICDGSMVWLDRDIKAGREVLSCESKDCGFLTPEDTIRLTRESMKTGPPDILLTTTEMMNRHMSNAAYWTLFGIRTRPPRVFLLDEIHTNEGTSGANTALLIRRWRYLSRNNQCVFVGLSATLADPQRFFSALTGLTENQVISIEPQILEEKGAEYLIALRSDPTSGAGVLSTSIQTIMLLRRMLDTDSAISGGVIGQRIFTFTDKLDVTNRLFDDFRDAEGIDKFGKIDTSYSPKTLANLRSSQHSELRERDEAGQVWRAAEEIGHGIVADEPLTIGRTAAQDPGVDERDVIIATSALEVGFNDPTVGAMVQHKAPHDAARFLQRKGRAGRTEIMRPYTVVVLSDFGRDRIAYQSYDQLFSPVLDPINLPIKNRYVLRMQAAYCLIDWIATEVIPQNRHIGAAWQFLSQKENFNGNRINALRLLNEVLENGPALFRLKGFLRQSLVLEDEEVDLLLWQAPRSLLTHVIPTLHRELNSWVDDQLPDVEDHSWKPLLDFIPQAMFGDLLIPEVELRLPAPQRNREARTEVLGIAQTLKEFTPGRFSRRYGFTHGAESHWVPVPLEGGKVTVKVPGETYQGDWIAESTVKTSKGLFRYPVFRPNAMTLEQPRGLSPSTNGSPLWHCEIISANKYPIELVQSRWVNDLFDGIEVFCHALGGSLEVRRFMTRSTGRLVNDRGTTVQFDATFLNEANSEVALGFTIDADGIRVLLKPWDATKSITADVLPSLNSSWFNHLVATTEELGERNEFLRGWLRVIAVGAIQKVPSAKNFFEAWQQVVVDPNHTLLKMAAQEILGLPSTEHQPQVLIEVLREIDDTEVIIALSNCVSKVKVSNPDFLDFVRNRYVATIAGAFVEALVRLIPSVNADDLVVDLDAFSHLDLEDKLEFWITESDAGSSGVIEAIVNAYQYDPQIFWRNVERSLDPSDLEEVDIKIADILTMVTSQDEITQGFAKVRETMNGELSDYHDSISQLFGLLEKRGIQIDHKISVALSSRLLAIGTTSVHDSWRQRLRTDWISDEARLGIEIDLRSFACKWATDIQIDTLVGPNKMESCDRHSFVQSLLWPRGGLVREQQFELNQPFGSTSKPDRLLIPLSQRNAVHVSVGRAVIDAQLLIDGQITIYSDSSSRGLLVSMMKDLAVNPTDSGFLNVHPRLTSCIRRGDEIHLGVELIEVLR